MVCYPYCRSICYPSIFKKIGFFKLLIPIYDHETNINKRTDKYVSTVNDALKDPSKNIQNIYFGLIMGISAMLPTMIHFMMFLKSSFFTIISNNKRLKGI